MHLLKELGVLAHRQPRQPVEQSQRSIYPWLPGSGNWGGTGVIRHRCRAGSALLRGLAGSSLMLHLLHHSHRGQVGRFACACPP